MVGRKPVGINGQLVWKEINRREPQRSVLRVVLFNIFTHDDPEG